jgi:hypothetical protein
MLVAVAALNTQELSKATVELAEAETQTKVVELLGLDLLTQVAVAVAETVKTVDQV